MELYEAIYKRRTVRKFLEKEVDFDAVKRILEAGNRAPTWNHNRNWSYIVLRTEEEKAYAFEHAKKIAEKFDAEKYLNAPRPYPTTLAQKMYAYAMPRQYTMLKDAPYVIIPVFKSKELNGEYVSKLNPFSTIWCRRTGLLYENSFERRTRYRESEIKSSANIYDPCIYWNRLCGPQREGIRAECCQP